VITIAKAVVCPLDAEDISRWVFDYARIDILLISIPGLFYSAISILSLSPSRLVDMAPVDGLSVGISLSI